MYSDSGCTIVVDINGVLHAVLGIIVAMGWAP